MIGGAAFQRKAQAPRKILGIPIPERSSGVEKLGQQVGEAAKQFNRLANEVRAARERAEKVAKAFS